MKKILKSALILALVLSTVLAFTACSLFNKDDDATAGDEPTVYTEDTALGEGAKTLTVRIEDPDKSVTFTIHTDKTTVGDALVEHGIIAGEEDTYGLYIKVANGVTADFDTDGSYWAFYIGSDYAMTGVSQTAIEEGVLYRLVYTK